MSQGKRWLRDELIIAMNLYCKLPFCKLHRNNKLIIDVANKLGRTPSSLAMKLVNLASLDPTLQLRNIKGLKGSSKADKEIFMEFQNNWEILINESEEKLEKLLNNQQEIEPIINEDNEIGASLITEIKTVTTVRRGQTFFRKTILASYNYRCCITGNPIPELLIASHILPWHKYPKNRLNPQNGLCLAKTQDAAFDKGLISFDDNYCLLLSKYILSFLPEQTLENNFVIYAGKQINLPEKFIPKLEFIRYHRENIFLGT